MLKEQHPLFPHYKVTTHPHPFKGKCWIDLFIFSTFIIFPTTIHLQLFGK